MHDDELSLAEFFDRYSLPSSHLSTTLSAEGGWMETLGKIAPILGGIGSFGSFINSVVSSRETAAFQHELISSLQRIETTLQSIKTQLDAIYQVLRDLERELVGLRLNDKITAIQTWGQQMAALSPTDRTGAETLATAMLDPTQGASNLLGCMNSLHNAMVGNDLGKPLIEQVDAPSFLRLRARLVQGLQLLAFATAFNKTGTYDYGVYLLQWSANFEQQLRLFFEKKKDTFPLSQNQEIFKQGELRAGDTVLIAQLTQPTLANVALAFEGNGQLIHAYTGVLGSSVPPSLTKPVLGFPSGAAGFCAADLAENRTSTDQDSALFRQCDPFANKNRWLLASLHYFSGLANDTFTSRARLVCGARFNAAQVFLGASNGQLAWVSSSGPSANYLGSIHNGSSTAAPLLTCNIVTDSVASTPLDELRSLSPTLWNVAYAAAGKVTISANSSPAGARLYLTLDGIGDWQITRSAVQLTVQPAPPTLSVAGNPFDMAGTTVGLVAPNGKSKSVLFRQF